MSALSEKAVMSGTKQPRPFVIGLTGPIASGKSTVAEMLRERGAAIIDADDLYRSMLAPNSGLWKRIVARFGTGIVGANDEIDRGRLGAIVFRDSAALEDLDRLTHPAVVAEIRRQIAAATADVVVIEAVKLVQAGLLADVDSLRIVTADRETRLRRLMARTGLDEARARVRVDASSDALSFTVPFFVSIDNSGVLSTTAEAVESAWGALGMEGRDTGRAGSMINVKV